MEQIPAGVFSSAAPITFHERPRSSEAPLCILSYFAMKGRAEVCRLILAEAALPHNERVWWVGNLWKETEKPKMPFGMLPVLEIPGEVIAQSGTIVRYLASVACLDGGPHLSGRTRADMIYETALELKDLKSELVTDEHSDLQAMIEGKSGNQRWGKLTGILSGLSRMLSQAGGCFFVGGKLSYADLAVFNTFQYFDAIQSGCLQSLGFEDLERFRVSILERPKITAYLASDRCYPFTELEVLKAGYQTNGQPMGLKYIQPLRKEQWQQTTHAEHDSLAKPLPKLRTFSHSSPLCWCLGFLCGATVTAYFMRRR
eukprot:TRINITY_DN111733_c0_g1_i1.p1 TRINITY_DN111733_c0_g1~~TRINITY_DN111733_c0_g1_i1.p1  ORF type:complete len:329 (+),score=37.72 TRINITY_DN111733_c0_g1_i1:46-987(+)